MVEVFKTNVQELKDAERIIISLSEQFPAYKINFDLSDCDKVLRVENKIGEVEYGEVIRVVRRFDYTIEIMVDCLPLPKLV